jgi:hypothetical protein
MKGGLIRDAIGKAVELHGGNATPAARVSTYASRAALPFLTPFSAAAPRRSCALRMGDLMWQRGTCAPLASQRRVHTHPSYSRDAPLSGQHITGAAAASPPFPSLASDGNSLLHEVDPVLEADTSEAVCDTLSSSRYEGQEVRQHRRRHHREERGKRRQARQQQRTSTDGDATTLPMSLCSRIATTTHKSAGYSISPPEELSHCIQRGEWESALLHLQQGMLGHTTDRAATLPHMDAHKSANPAYFITTPGPSCVTLEELCLWLLLWHEQEAAAWKLWQRMRHQTLPPSASSSSLSGAVPSAVSPTPPLPLPLCGRFFTARLALVLSLYLHFVVQDPQRTGDMLLLGELAWKAEANAGGSSKLSACVASPAHTGLEHRTPVVTPSSERFEEAQWIALLLAWLRCLASDATDAPSHRLHTTFAHLALQHTTRCVEEGQWDDAAVIALLLLHVHDGCAGAEAQLFVSTAPATSVPRDHVASSFHSTPPSPELQETRALVEGEFLRTVKTRHVDTLRAPPQRVSSDASTHDVDVAGERSSKAGPVRQRLRCVFATAARQLDWNRHHHSSKQRNAVAADDVNAATTSGGLATYRFWFRHLVSALHCEHQWNALVGASTSSLSARDTVGRAGDRKRTEHNRSAAIEELRAINTATDRGDWVAALRLCLSDPTAKDGTTKTTGRESVLPWLQRLRKGLTACEALGKRKSSGTVPWHGALALWHLAQRHHPDPRDEEQRRHIMSGEGLTALRHEYGRIFMLLASATRWSEALRCFAATPTPCIDGFVVAQVGYALRASPAHCDWAVLNLWAAWRCRVGDMVEPTGEMVVQLLQAMLHTSSPSLSATSGRTREESATVDAAVAAAAASSTTMGGEVATGLLVAAAATTTAAEMEHAVVVESSVASLPGTTVPLDWHRHRSLVRRVFNDRWTGTWAEALQVAVASADVSLLRSAAARVPRSALRACSVASPSVTATSTLYVDTMEHLRRRGVALSAGDRAALWSLWGPVSEVASDNASQADGALPLQKSDVDVAQVTLNAEKLLDELLGGESL